MSDFIKGLVARYSGYVGFIGIVLIAATCFVLALCVGYYFVQGFLLTTKPLLPFGHGLFQDFFVIAYASLVAIGLYAVIIVGLFRYKSLASWVASIPNNINSWAKETSEIGKKV